VEHSAEERGRGRRGARGALFDLLQVHGIGTRAPTSDPPDWAPKVSLGWARVRGGRDGAARLPATDPRGHRTNLDMSRLRGLVGVQGGRCDRGRAFLLGPSTRPD
jgi:hypothetical protein